MIGFLKGNLLEKHVERLLMDVNGVGYEIEISPSTLCKLPDVNTTVSLYIFTHVREDNIRLFGFQTLLDKKVFQTVLDVSGVGPKVALALLGAMDGQELIDAIMSDHLHYLKNVPGVGPKTAQRLMLELRSKFEKLSVNLFPFQQTSTQIPTKQNLFLEELQSAFTNLGYKDKQFGSLIKQIKQQLDSGLDLKFDVILKDSLKKLTQQNFH